MSRRTVPIITAVLLLISIIIISAANTQKNTEEASRRTFATISQAENASESKVENMRGVWITFMDLSMEYESDKSEAAFRRKFEKTAADCAAFGFNTLIVQARPFCDALYDSKLFPASHILSGEQGKSAGYDALKIMCEISRRHGLKIHAWINPYRVTADNTPPKLSADNPAVKDKSLTIETESGIILDPSNKTARKLITDGVREIIENYDIDGIQIDDYFYPPDIGSLDDAQYRAYLKTMSDGKAMDVATWRSFNVSLLMSEIYLTVHRNERGAVFGISPQGNLENNAQLSADVISWCAKKGFADYICPQIYFSIENPALGFETALGEWSSLEYAENVKLLVGLAGYKAGSDADDGTWQNKSDVLKAEYNILKKNQKVSGFIVYSYASLSDKKAEAEMENLSKAIKSEIQN